MNVRVLVDGAKIGDAYDSEIEELNGICRDRKKRMG